jgi:hypothetical protein
MFGKLFGSFRKEKKEPELDLSFNYERSLDFKNYLRDGNYSNFEKEYENLSWDAKTLLAEGIGLNPAFENDIDNWKQKSPDSYISHLFAGISLTQRAWVARTAALGANVSEKRAQQFMDLLEAASQELKLADELNGEDAEICARIIRVYMGLGAEKEATFSFFHAAIQFEPDHLMAHLMMINYLTPKWRGSIEEMYAFAHERMEETGNPLLMVLLSFAITEERMYYDITDDKEKKDAFFKNEELRNSIHEMYKDFTEPENGKLLVPVVYNYFAFLFYQIDEIETARLLIRKTDGKMTIYPWAYLGISNYKKLLQL